MCRWAPCPVLALVFGEGRAHDLIQVPKGLLPGPFARGPVSEMRVIEIEGYKEEQESASQGFT